MTNAAKYTDRGGRIELSCKLDNNTAVLTVRYNGISIAPESIEQIFDIFSQEESGSNRSDGRLGIGLALVKGLVQLHGGRVDARSAGRDCGSTFTVRLPMTARD